MKIKVDEKYRGIRATRAVGTAQRHAAQTDGNWEGELVSILYGDPTRPPRQRKREREGRTILSNPAESCGKSKFSSSNLGP
jgi:hypothetical protein